MVYYHIRLCEGASSIRMIILPWKKYHYKRLTMGVSNSPNIFQQKMKNLFQEFEIIRAYIGELVILTGVDWMYHSHKLELTLNRMK